MLRNLYCWKFSVWDVARHVAVGVPLSLDTWAMASVRVWWISFVKSFCVSLTRVSRGFCFAGFFVWIRKLWWGFLDHISFPLYVTYVKFRSSFGHNGVWSFRIDVRMLYVDEGGSSIQSDGSRVWSVAGKKIEEPIAVGHQKGLGQNGSAHCFLNVNGHC